MTANESLAAIGDAPTSNRLWGVSGTGDGAAELIRVGRADQETAALLDDAGRALRRMARHLPPADLPATLASIDDVATVCEAAKVGGFINSTARTGCWGLGKNVIVNAWVEDGAWDDMLHVEVSHEATCDRLALLNDGSPGVLLWHSIQAARSAS